MKCVKNKATGHVLRVPNDEAEKLVAAGGWHYVPKSVWRRKIRRK